MSHAYALYQISIKALLYKDNKIFVLYTPDGYVDFPGGRIDPTEQKMPWQDTLKREIAEEVGDSVTVEVDKTLFASQRQYSEDGQTHYVAAIYYACQWQGGHIQLSDEHSSYEWLTPQELLATNRSFASADEKYQLQTLLS